MQNHPQFRVKINITDTVTIRFAPWQLWPLAVTVLRTGLIFTTGHPFQVAVQLPSVFIGVSHSRLLASNRSK
jgi:hypothetical protein